MKNISNNDKKTCDHDVYARKTKFVTKSEKTIERYLITQVSMIGGLAMKFSSFISIGYPDRMILLDGAKVCWAEIKTTGKKPTTLQRIRHESLKAFGFKVYVVDSIESVDEMINEIKKEIL